MKRILLSLLLMAAAFAGDANAQQTTDLPSWGALPRQLVGQSLSYLTTDGERLQGKMLNNNDGNFTIEISKTTDAGRFPKGQAIISHRSIAEIHGSPYRFPFRAFSDFAFREPFKMAARGYGLFSFLADMGGAMLGGGGPDPLAIGWRIPDYIVGSPFWFAWGVGGLAITPIVAPIGWLAGSVHYDYRVQ